ncbi:MAG: YraN family protein [Gammaproteobacteria bacterium]|nr:MAG: YraN family protein [Gammaproteobacteria bacterium]
MAADSAKSLGRAAEGLAERYLVGNGLLLVERNFLCRHGEIDLVMRDGGTLIFVEVRLRHANRFASAAASVNLRKQRKLVRAAGIYLGRRRQFRQYAVRFDVLALDARHAGSCRTSDEFTIQWLRDAFRPEGQGL